MKNLSNCDLRAIAVVLTLALGINMAGAQENNRQVDVSVGSDIVSSYIFRGERYAGVSIQPYISVAKSGFSFTAWGSAGFGSSDTKELELTLAYETGRLGIALTDDWIDYDEGTRYFEYAAHKTAHTFEITLEYDFDLFSLNWNTYFAGDDYTKANGKRAYSTYAEAIVPFRLGGYDFEAEIGLTPWEGAYAGGLNVVNLSLGASKEIKITDSFSLPAFVKLTFNPNQDKAFFVFGVEL